MILIGQYGWKIRNYKAATIVGKNTGVRDRYDYTDAMIHHSLFTKWLKENGMQTDKNDESTKDLICIDFQFGLRSYKEEQAHIKKLYKDAEKIENKDEYKRRIDFLDGLKEKIESRKDLYKKMSNMEIREYLYVNGADITYTKLDKETEEYVPGETIHYKMLYRNPSKAKEGSCMFIREELYDKAYDWITMGIGPRMPYENAKIVEISAYAPLSCSATEGTMVIPVEDVLLLEDQDSFFRTIADIVRTEEYETVIKVKDPKTNRSKTQKVTKKKCKVEREEIDIKNTLWDGMALIETSIMPEFCNGMALLRNHFFKACAFRSRIQQFFMDYCAKNGIDYDTFVIKDMFGKEHLAKDIKLITTDNATKFKKFKELIGGDFCSAYEYWMQKVRDNNNIWGIVKTDHQSKLGDVQQMSYQMVNTLPCTKPDMIRILQPSTDYVERLRNDLPTFLDYLKREANIVNCYSMLLDLYEWNPDIVSSRFWKDQKTIIIRNYIVRLRKGKIILHGDNLTVCGNPYALLLYAVGEDWSKDPTLVPEKRTVQVYTTRFEDGVFLCGIRSPQNSANNIGYFHNIKHPLMEKYFDFSPNIMAVNCIQTDIQARMNGEDSKGQF